MALLTFVLYPILFYLIIYSESFFFILLPERWSDAVIYFQLFCIIMFLRPIALVNLNIIKVLGKADILFKVNIFKRIIGIAVFLISAQWGLLAIIVGQIFVSFINCLITIFITKHFISYTYREQIIDIFPNFFMCFLTGIILYRFNTSMSLDPFLSILFGTIIMFGIYVLLSQLFKLNGLQLLKNKILK